MSPADSFQVYQMSFSVFDGLIRCCRRNVLYKLEVLRKVWVETDVFTVS